MAGLPWRPAVRKGRSKGPPERAARKGRQSRQRGPALIPLGEDLLDPLTALWICAATGWSLVCAGLWRGLTGPTRKAALTAHWLTLGAVPTVGSVLGFGLLYVVIASTALWWALVAVTGLRPERLVDPAGGALLGLAVWLAVGGMAAWSLHQIVF